MKKITVVALLLAFIVTSTKPMEKSLKIKKKVKSLMNQIRPIIEGIEFKKASDWNAVDNKVNLLLKQLDKLGWRGEKAAANYRIQIDILKLLESKLADLWETINEIFDDKNKDYAKKILEA